MRACVRACVRVCVSYIYIDNRFDYEIIMNLNMYKQWEGLVIKVKGDTLTNPFIICNVYIPPRSTIPVLRGFLMNWHQ